MEEAKRLVNKSPLPGSTAFMPIDLPDITGATILEVLKDEDGEPVKSKEVKTESIKF